MHLRGDTLVISFVVWASLLQVRFFLGEKPKLIPNIMVSLLFYVVFGNALPCYPSLASTSRSAVCSRMILFEHFEWVRVVKQHG